MLSERDAIYIRKAQKRHSHSSQFGKDLKNEILSHKQHSADIHAEEATEWDYVVVED